MYLEMSEKVSQVERKATTSHFVFCLKLSTKFKIIKQFKKISLFKRLKGKAVHFFSFAKFEALETITWFPNNGLSLMT